MNKLSGFAIAGFVAALALGGGFLADQTPKDNFLKDREVAVQSLGQLYRLAASENRDVSFAARTAIKEIPEDEHLLSFLTGMAVKEDVKKDILLYYARTGQLSRN